MTRGVYHEQLHKDGLWRIKNFKYLVKQGSATVEDLRLEVVIGKVTEPGEQPGKEADEIVPVPIGDLPSLRRNGLIRDGFLLRTDHQLVEARKERLTLDLSRSNLTFFNRFDEENSEPIIPRTRSSIEEDNETLYVGIGHNGDRYGIIIPSVDIFLFFYANSTFMTQLVLSEHILNPERSIYDSEKSVNTDLHKKIWLKKGVPEQDVGYLAMLLFDEYALEAAKGIFTDRGPSGRSSKRWPIRALPPIEGKVGLKLLGRNIGKNRLLVTQITSCDWVPPFHSLEWDRDGRSSTTSTGGGSQMVPLALNDIEPAEQITDEGVDRRKSPSPVYEPHIDQRLPGLKKVPVKRSPKPDPTEKRGGRYVRKTVPVKVATTAPGGPGSEKKRKAEFRGKEKNPAGTSEEDKELENFQLNANDVQNQSIATAIILFQAHKHKLAKVCFLDGGFQTKELPIDENSRVPLCLLPTKHEGKDKAWLYSDEHKRRQRVAVIARVELDGKVRYVFELQMRLTQGISTGLIWTESDNDAPEERLYELLLGFADPTGSDALMQSTARNDLQWGRCKHNHKVHIDWKHPELFAEDFLSRLFSQPQATRRATRSRRLS